jgi:transposase
MIVLPSGARVWLACGYTDMRKGMDGLAMLAQQGCKKTRSAAHYSLFAANVAG